MNLNPQQTAAVNSTSPRLLVLASPGAGKTATVVARIQRIIGDGEAPSRIVAITFTRKAAKELESRLGGVKLGYCGTLHGFMLMLLKRHGHLLGYESINFGIIDQEAADQLLSECMRDCGFNGSKKEVLEVGSMLNFGKMQGKTACLNASKRYRNQLVGNCLLTFDLILSEGLRLTNRVDLPYSHLMVDEVQDLTNLEFTICTSLKIENLFMVGDIDQGIYSFKGSNVNNILSLCHED